MGKLRSETQKEVWFEEALVGLEHYVTRTYDENGKLVKEGRGNTPEEAQRIEKEKREYNLN